MLNEELTELQVGRDKLFDILRANHLLIKPNLITDVYSKKIVGYNVSNNLSTEGSIQALKLAIKTRVYDRSIWKNFRAKNSFN